MAMRKRWEGETVVVAINFELWFPSATASRDRYVIVSRASKDCNSPLFNYRFRVRERVPSKRSTLPRTPSPHRSIFTCASKEIYRAHSSSDTIHVLGALTKRVSVLDSRLELEVSQLHPETTRQTFLVLRL